MKKLMISLILVFVAVSSAFAKEVPPELSRLVNKGNSQQKAGDYKGFSNTINEIKALPVMKAEADKKLNQAINLYKSSNYIDAMITLQNITAYDPGNALAHYYLGMTYVQMGDSEKASAEYERVISISPKSQLADYAKIGKDNLSGAPLPPKPEIEITPVGLPKKEEFLSDQAKEKLQETKLKNVIKNLNDNKEAKPDLYKNLNNLSPDKKSSNETVPSKEEIAQAMQTLTKAGINPAGAYNSNPYGQVSPEMMQMNMLMSTMGGGNMYGSNNNNSGMNMMPLMMMMQNGQGNSKVDPEMIQSMLSTMMMPDMMNLYDSKNNNDN